MFPFRFGRSIVYSTSVPDYYNSFSVYVYCCTGFGVFKFLAVFNCAIYVNGAAVVILLLRP